MSGHKKQPKQKSHPVSAKDINNNTATRNMLIDVKQKLKRTEQNKIIHTHSHGKKILNNYIIVYMYITRSTGLTYREV